MFWVSGDSSWLLLMAKVDCDKVSINNNAIIFPDLTLS